MLDLNEKLGELARQKFDNVIAQFEGWLNVIEHTKTILEEFISQSEAQGHIVSTNYYQALIDQEKKNIKKLEEERDNLIDARDKAVASGAIKKYSEEWYSMSAEIDEVTASIEAGNTALLEYANNIREIEWEVFDLLQERISNVTKESEFLIDLMSNDKLYVEEGKGAGQLTNEGMATMGLHGQNYNTNMYQADLYAEEIGELDKQIAKDPYDQELINRRQELLELQQESILAAEAEKDAIRDMVEEGIELELDALQELIDKYNDAMDAQRDLYDYQKDVQEQAEEIASLEKQLAAFAGDDSEESKAKMQEIRVSLEEAKDDLEETEYDKYISDQEQLLDELYLEYETILNERLDNLDALIRDMTAEINANAGTIGETLSQKAEDVGYKLSESMNQIWQKDDFANVTTGITSVITTYGDKFTAAQTSTNAALNVIDVNIQKMITQLNKIAGTKVTAAKQSSSTVKKKKTTNKNNNTNKNKNKNKNNNKGDGTPKVGDKVKFVSGTYYYDSYGTRPLGNQKQGKYVYITNINKKGSHPYHISTGKKLGSGDLGWLKLSQISGYASGAKSLHSNEIAWTQEDGREFIIRPSDGAILTPLAKSDSVLNADASNNLWDMANSPSEFIKDSLGIGDVNTVSGNGATNSYVQNFDKVVFNLPNVRSYDELLSAMQKDKNFEKLILSMTIDRIAGGSSLGKGKSIR